MIFRGPRLDETAGTRAALPGALGRKPGASHEEPMSAKRKEAIDDETGPLHTIAEAQAALRCSRTKIYSLWKAGRLELVKFDRGTRVTDRSLQKLLRELHNNHQLEVRRDADA